MSGDAGGGNMRIPLQDSRPELDGISGVRLFDGIARQVSEWSVVEHHRAFGSGSQTCHYGAVPIDFMTADAHGGALEAVTDQSAAGEFLHRVPDLLLRGAGSIEEQPVSLGP